MGHKASPKDVQERVHLVSLMLRRKSTSYILNYAARVWGLGRGQAYGYIRAAKADWQIYFNNLKANGKAYHVTQLRDLKDQAFSIKRIVGKGKDKRVIRTPNLPLVLEIAKEEAKLMGAYPVERHEINLTNNFAQWVKEVKKKKELNGNNFGLQNKITGEVLEGIIVSDDQTDESEEFEEVINMQDKIIEKALVRGEKEEEQIDLT